MIAQNMVCAKISNVCVAQGGNLTIVVSRSVPNYAKTMDVVLMGPASAEKVGLISREETPVRRRCVKELRTVTDMVYALPTPKPRKINVTARILGLLKVSVRRSLAPITALNKVNATMEPVPVLTIFGVSTAETSSARSPTDSRRATADVPVMEHVQQMVCVTAKMASEEMRVNFVPAPTIATVEEHVLTEFASASTNTLEMLVRRYDVPRTRAKLIAIRTDSV